MSRSPADSRARVRRGGRLRRLELGPERPEDTAGNGQAADHLARPAAPRPRGEDRCLHLGGRADRHAGRRAGRAGHAGQGDHGRLGGAAVLRPRPGPGRTPRRPRPLAPPAAACRAQRTQVTAAGRAASRSAPIGCPHRSHTPYRPSASRRSASSNAATCSRAASSRAAACWRSSASVAPSGSCSSSVPAALAASAARRTPLQRGHPLPRAGPLGQQQVPFWLHCPNL